MSTSGAKKSLSDRIEEHPLRYILGSVIGAGTLVAAVMAFFWNEHIELLDGQHALKIEQIGFDHGRATRDLESRVSAIERRLGGQRYLDVRTLFESGKVANDQPATDLVYFAESRYFAATDSDRWAVKEIHEAELHEAILGENRENIHPPSVLETMGKFDSRLWRGKSTFTVQDSNYVKEIFPYIMVQNLDYDLMPEFFFNGEISSTSAADAIGSGVVDQKTLDALEVFVHADASGIFLTKKLSGIMEATKGDPSISYLLRNVQKVGPVVYAQVVFKLMDARVNGKVVPEFFIVSEWFVMARKEGLLSIEAVTPSLDPAFSGQEFIDANLWIASFYIPPV